MKEKDFIKLSLLDKNINHDKIKSNIFSDAEMSDQTTEKRFPRRRQLRAWAVTACLFLLTVSAVGVPLMLNYADDSGLSAASIEENSPSVQEQSTETSSMNISSDTTLNRKIVYGDGHTSELDNKDKIYYPYGTLRIGYALQSAMDDLENADALFNVSIIYFSEKLVNDSDDVEYMQANENYEYLTRTSNQKIDEYRDYIESTYDNLEPLFKEQKVSEDLLLKFYTEFRAEISPSLEMQDYCEGLKFRFDSKYRLMIKRINAVQMDDQTRNELIDQLDRLRTEAKAAVDADFAAEEKYEQIRAAKHIKLIEEYFERNGLNYSEIVKKYGKLLLTKEEILLLTVNDQEKLKLVLLSETSDNSPKMGDPTDKTK